MADVSILAWRADVLERSLPSMKAAFQSPSLFACCQQKDLQKVREMGIFAFSAQGANDFFRCEQNGTELTIGHKRNLMQLSSLALGSSPLVFLDDDVQPEADCESKFSSAFSKYSLVQGAFTGCIGNGLYIPVYFFDHLLEHSKDANFAAVSDSMLRGVVRAHFAPASLRGITGGIFGVSAALKCRQAFFPTKYQFDDHFFEFCCRHNFPSLKFMDGSTSPAEIPVAEHSTVPSPSTSKLVDHYILYVKSAIVESHSYFRLCGRIPMLINGRHTLVKLGRFDAQEECSRICAEAALDKFRAAAEHHLQAGFGEPIDSQLHRFVSLGEKDLFVPQEELEAEWENFKMEMEWIKEALAFVSENPKKAYDVLFRT